MGNCQGLDRPWPCAIFQVQLGYEKVSDPAVVGLGHFWDILSTKQSHCLLRPLRIDELLVVIFIHQEF